MSVIRYFRENRYGPEALMVLMALAMPFAFNTWMALINNFSVERAGFTGVEIGTLQSLREIPGFLAFAVVFALVLVREQTLALVALLLLGIGVAVTGMFPTVIGLYVTTVIMSVGFHYYETLRQSLVLQWVEKERAPEFLGQLIATGSFSGLVAFGTVYLLLDVGGVDMVWIYLLAGGVTAAVAVYCWIAYPRFPEKVEQHKHIVLRKRYWLFYLLTFMAGARRQIFVVFAGFLMVEKFGFSAAAVALMFLANGTINIFFAPLVGRLVARWGERHVLILEYVGLVGIFTAYAFVDTAWVAVLLYILDHLFFSMALAIKTYFQKIADPADMASSAGVSFTINHIAAVVLPVAYGYLWIHSPSAVFLTGAALAGCSLLLALLVPRHPEPGAETWFTRRAQRPAVEAGE